MKVDYVNSMRLPDGFRVKQYEDTDIQTLSKDPAKLRLVTNAINLYVRQKDCLVRGRTALLALIVEKAKYVRPTDKITVDGKEETEFRNTEGEDIKAFINGLSKGTITNAAVTAPDEETRETQALAYLQTLANLCGEQDKDGKPLENPPCFVVDLSEAEKRESKPKKLPVYALEGATNIINNKSEKKWLDRFTKGYTNSAGIVLPAISFEPFTIAAPKDAKPEETQAIREKNIQNLGWALVQDDANVRERTKKEYA